MINLTIKIIIFILALLSNASICQKLYDQLNKGIERAYYRSEIDHFTYLNKSKSVSAFCTILFVIILIFTSISITFINF